MSADGDPLRLNRLRREDRGGRRTDTNKDWAEENGKRRSLIGKEKTCTEGNPSVSCCFLSYRYQTNAVGSAQEPAMLFPFPLPGGCLGFSDNPLLQPISLPKVPQASKPPPGFTGQRTFLA